MKGFPGISHYKTLYLYDFYSHFHSLIIYLSVFLIHKIPSFIPKIMNKMLILLMIEFMISYTKRFLKYRWPESLSVNLLIPIIDFLLPYGRYRELVESLKIPWGLTSSFISLQALAAYSLLIEWVTETPEGRGGDNML